MQSRISTILVLFVIFYGYVNSIDDKIKSYFRLHLNSNSTRFGADKQIRTEADIRDLISFKWMVNIAKNLIRYGPISKLNKGIMHNGSLEACKQYHYAYAFNVTLDPTGKSFPRKKPN